MIVCFQPHTLKSKLLFARRVRRLLCSKDKNVTRSHSTMSDRSKGNKSPVAAADISIGARESRPEYTSASSFPVSPAPTHQQRGGEGKFNIGHDLGLARTISATAGTGTSVPPYDLDHGSPNARGDHDATAHEEQDTARATKGAPVLGPIVTRTAEGEPYSIFTRRQKAVLVGVASWSASFSALSAQIYFPAITEVASSLGITPEKVNISVTVYMIFQGLAPSFWGPLSDRKGRRIVILSTFTVYIGACLGLALTKTYAQLLVLRALQSSGSASTIAIGAGILGDMTTREERGGYMGVFQAALNLPLALGPVIGGAMAETVGWRAIFWFLLAYAGAFTIFAAIVLPETLRTIVGNGVYAPRRWIHRSPLQSLWTPRDGLQKSQPTIEDAKERADAPAPAPAPAVRPYRLRDTLLPVLLLGKRDVSLSVAFLSLHYTVWQMVMTATATLFGTVYGLSVLDIGLCFISSGAGCMVGTLVLGRLLDKDYARIKASSAAEGIPLSTARARLRTAWLYSVIQVAMTLLFGWTIDRRVHIAAPIVSLFVITASAVSIQAQVNTFLVDNFPREGASVTATLNLARCWLGAGGTAAVLPLANAIGIGWAFTLLALVLVASNILVVMLLVVQDNSNYGKHLPDWIFSRRGRRNAS